MERAQHSNERTVADQLREAGDSASRGMVQEALDIIAALRKAYPKNIYIIGIRKQIQKLLTSPDSTTRSDILSSLPQLIERAILESTVSDRLQKNRSVQIEDTQARSRATALDRLKAQYLGHAERYFQRGEYEKALIELRRIQIIAPGDEQIDAFEQKLVRLLESPDSAADFLIQRNEGPATSRMMEELLSRRPGPEEVPEETPPPPPQNAGLLRPPKQTSIATTVSKGSRAVRHAVIVAVIVAVIAVLFFSLRMGANETTSSPNGELTDSLKHVDRPALALHTPPAPVQHETNAEERPAIRIQEATPQKTIVQPDPPPPPIASADQPDEAVRTIEPEARPVVITQAPVVRHDTTGFAALRFTSENLSVPPRIARVSDPNYPDSALATNLSGQVIVLVQLDSRGHPLSAKVYKSSHYIFENPAVQAALRSSYAPGATETGNVPTWIAVPFLFRPARSGLSITD